VLTHSYYMSPTHCDYNRTQLASQRSNIIIIIISYYNETKVPPSVKVTLTQSLKVGTVLRHSVHCSCVWWQQTSTNILLPKCGRLVDHNSRRLRFTNEIVDSGSTKLHWTDNNARPIGPDNCYTIRTRFNMQIV